MKQKQVKWHKEITWSKSFTRWFSLNNKHVHGSYHSLLIRVFFIYPVAKDLFLDHIGIVFSYSFFSCYRIS